MLRLFGVAIRSWNAPRLSDSKRRCSLLIKEHGRGPGSFEFKTARAEGSCDQPAFAFASLPSVPWRPLRRHTRQRLSFAWPFCSTFT